MNDARPRILRLDDLPAQPWANGQGTTTEILREGDPSDWAWRVSVASIDRPGPFSAYPGIDRTLICAGPGSITLGIGDETCDLAPGERVDFPGEADVQTLQVSAPSRDLNVMTRRERASAAVGTLQLDGGSTTIHCPTGTTMLLVVLSGRCRAEDQELGPLDAVVLRDGQCAEVSAEEARADVGTAGPGISSAGARLAMISLRLTSEPPDAAGVGGLSADDPLADDSAADDPAGAASTDARSAAGATSAPPVPDEPTEDGGEPDLWSPAARSAYLAAMDALVADLQRQTRLVAALDEQHFQHDPDTHGMWFASVDLVQRALNAAHDAEAAWIGASSLPAVDLEEDDDAPELMGVWQEPAGDVVTLVGRWDVRIRDMDAFIAAGREAYSRQYDLDDPSFAEASVSTPVEAAAALVDTPDWPELHIAGVSDPAAAFWQFVQHDGSDVGWVDDGDDPFDILDADGD